MAKKMKKDKVTVFDAEAAMSESIETRMGSTDLGASFDEDELLGDTMPNSFADTSGDPNQMSRSEEEELENNTNVNSADPSRNKALDNLIH